MSLYYSHTLIPLEKNFVPPANSVSNFLAAMEELGVLPANAELALRRPSNQVRRGVNPFTGELETFPCKTTTKLASLAEFELAAQELADYDVEVSSVGVPKVAPLPIDYSEPYRLAVAGTVSSVIRSTSDDDADDSSAVPFGRPCNTPIDVGVFLNPHTGSRIEVAGAGSAQFWLEFGLGRFLFPKLNENFLNILHPSIVAAAERVFGASFVQGCHWG